MGGCNKQFLGIGNHHNLSAHCSGDEAAGYVRLLCRTESVGARHGFSLDAGDKAENIGADGLCFRCADEDSHEVSSHEDVAMGTEEMAII